MIHRRRRLSDAPATAVVKDDDATTDDDFVSKAPVITPTAAPLASKNKNVPTQAPAKAIHETNPPTTAPSIQTSNDDDHAGNDDTTDGNHFVDIVPTLAPVRPKRPAATPKTLAPRLAPIHPPVMTACTGMGCSGGGTRFFLGASVLIMALLSIFLCRRRRRYDLDTSRGEYRRVTSRYTAEAFDDALGDDDDDDDFYGGGGGVSLLELQQLDRDGQLSLQEVNG